MDNLEQKVIQFSIIENIGEYIHAIQKWVENNNFNEKSKTIFSYGPSDDVYFSDDPDEIGMKDIYKPIGEFFKEGDNIHDLHKSRPIHELLSNLDEGEQFKLNGIVFEKIYVDLDEYLEEEED